MLVLPNSNFAKVFSIRKLESLGYEWIEYEIWRL